MLSFGTDYIYEKRDCNCVRVDDECAYSDINKFVCAVWAVKTVEKEGALLLSAFFFLHV